MKVIEDARNRVKSKATGIGTGCLRGISKEVQIVLESSGPLCGNGPRRAKSYNYGREVLVEAMCIEKYLILVIPEVETHPLVWTTKSAVLDSK